MGKAITQREGAVMILGGGIAGIQAALDMTDLGYDVYLVEISPAQKKLYEFFCRKL